MKCTQVERLIPLLVGDDLPVEQTVRLRGHLESCARCRQLVVEFEASRNWLIGFAAPEFDEATLNGVRDRVMEEIGRGEKRSGWLEWILPNWNPRFALAATAALLLLIAASALIIRWQQRPPIKPADQTMAGQADRNDKSESPRQIDRNDEQPDANPRMANRRPGSSRRKPSRPGSQAAPPVEFRPVDPDLLAQAPTTIEPATDQPVGAEPSKDDLAENRNLLRIEIQTADPNIRIIWFAPKPDTSPTTPNTK